MRRDGYIVVSSDHRLFPKSAAKAIEDRIQAVIAAVEERHSLTLTPMAFEIHQQPKAGRTAARYVRSLFLGNDNSRVRLIVSSEPIAAESLLAPFKNSDLVVTIEDAGAHTAKLRKGQVGARSANMYVTNTKIERAIEDIIIDISLGTYFRERSPVSDLIAQEGLDSLFRAKTKFFRERLQASWFFQVERGATYATLSSLNNLPDDDVEARAASAFDTWRAFCHSLTAASVNSTATTVSPESSDGTAPLKAGVDVKRSPKDLAQLPKIGGQLPIRRIVSASSRLPAGEHTLIVLQKSSNVRKSPSLRGQLTALFGERARRNSFRILSNERYLSTSHIIEKLSRSGHIFVAKIVLGDGD